MLTVGKLNRRIEGICDAYSKPLQWRLGVRPCHMPLFSIAYRSTYDVDMRYAVCCDLLLLSPAVAAGGVGVFLANQLIITISSWKNLARHIQQIKGRG